MADVHNPVTTTNAVEEHELARDLRLEFARFEHYVSRADLDRFIELKENREKQWPGLSQNQKEVNEAQYKLLELKLERETKNWQQALKRELGEAPITRLFQGFDDEPEEFLTGLPTTLEKLKQWQQYFGVREKYLAQELAGSPMSIPEMRLFIKRLLPEKLRRFFEQYCVLNYNKDTKKGGAEVTKDSNANRYVITIDSESFFSSEEHTYFDQNGRKQTFTLRYIDPTKLGMVIAMAIAEIMPQTNKIKEVWDEIRAIDRKAEIVKGRGESWQAFIALCIIDREQAKKISPEGFEEYERLISQLLGPPTAELPSGGVTIGDPKLNYQYILQDHDLARANRQTFWKRFLAGRGNEFIGFQLPSTGIDWYQVAIAEHDRKEISLYLERDENLTDRVKRFKWMLLAGNKNDMRRLIMANMQTGDCMNIFFHAYLYRFDHKYRETDGEQIEKESFDMIVRARRLSAKAKRHGSKPTEYWESPPGSGRYQRFGGETRKVWEDAVTFEGDSFGGRSFGGITYEAFQWDVRLDGSGFIGWHEKWGEGEHAYMGPAGDLRNILGREFAEQMVAFMHRCAERSGAGILEKLDPDQKYAVKRYYRMLEYEGMNPEHMMPIGIDAGRHYSKEAPEEFTQEALLTLESRKVVDTIRKEGKLIEQDPHEIFETASLQELINLYKNLGITEEKKRRPLTLAWLTYGEMHHFQDRILDSGWPESIKRWLQSRVIKELVGKVRVENLEVKVSEVEAVRRELIERLDEEAVAPTARDQILTLFDEIARNLYLLDRVRLYEEEIKPFSEVIEREAPVTVDKETVKKIKNVLGHALNRIYQGGPAKQIFDELRDKIQTGDIDPQALKNFEIDINRLEQADSHQQALEETIAQVEKKPDRQAWARDQQRRVLELYQRATADQVRLLPGEPARVERWLPFEKRIELSGSKVLASIFAQYDEQKFGKKPSQPNKPVDEHHYLTFLKKLIVALDIESQEEYKPPEERRRPIVERLYERTEEERLAA